MLDHGEYGRLLLPERTAARLLNGLVVRVDPRWRISCSRSGLADDGRAGLRARWDIKPGACWARVVYVLRGQRPQSPATTSWQEGLLTAMGKAA
jgi:hypothetical protein